MPPERASILRSAMPNVLAALLLVSSCCQAAARSADRPAARFGVDVDVAASSVVANECAFAPYSSSDGAVVMLEGELQAQSGFRARPTPSAPSAEARPKDTQPPWSGTVALGQLCTPNSSCPQTWNSIRNMTILLGQVLQLGALHTVGQQAGVHSRGGVLPERPPNPATGDQRGLSGGSHAQQEEAQLDAPGCNSAVQPGGPRRQPAPEAQSSEPQIRIAACTLRVLAILASRPGGDRFSMYANGASTPSTGAPPAAPRSPHKSVSPNVQCNPPVKSM
ncbi:hypothetical protein TSOC_001973 [Tetrabaena socialis]|uniref:Uncharacterized protein n=1 Tax=Tetrabaena socialis TaxID=47790 RepID=A0A2J8AFA5_9CHLO|nr:hypothetical protein TSOC_001973 [Tetrabaena socialis]|eukprot:PNH11213.1 hypothetical protein TSOC_001973 [Tetrabaena socialis]